MGRFVAVSCVLCVLIIGLAHFKAHAEQNEEAKALRKDANQLLSSAREERRRAMERLVAEYDMTSREIAAALAEAVAKHKNDDRYCSPLHCAIQAVNAWHVYRPAHIEPLLLSIVDYELDASSLPNGLDVASDYFYPAASALVRLRVDTKTVFEEIKTSVDPKRVCLLTWVLLQRAGSAKEAKALMQNARENGGGNGEASLARAARLLDRDPKLLLLSCRGKTTGKRAKSQ